MDRQPLNVNIIYLKSKINKWVKVTSQKLNLINKRYKRKLQSVNGCNFPTTILIAVSLRSRYEILCLPPNNLFCK